MHDQELRELRRELAGLERGPGKYYPDELRTRIAAWARRRIARGESVSGSALALALDRRTLSTWLQRRGGDAGREREQVEPTGTALVPVEIVEALPAPTTITLVSPSGYRLEGLTVDDAVRALARLR